MFYNLGKRIMFPLNTYASISWKPWIWTRNSHKRRADVTCTSFRLSFFRVINSNRRMACGSYVYSLSTIFVTVNYLFSYDIYYKIIILP